MAKHEHYDQEEARYFREWTGQERMDDAGSIWLARELDALRTQIYDQETLPFNALNIFAVQSDAASWQETITYRVIGSYGMARIITDFSSDIPTVGIWGASATVTIYTVADAYRFSTQEIEKAIATGKNLEGRLALAARRGIDAKINDLVWHGDVDYGIVGLFDNQNIHHTTGITITTGQQLLDAIVNAMQLIMTRTKGLHAADTVVLPVSYSKLLTAQMPNTSVSYKTFLIQENPNVKLVFIHEMDDFEGDGTNKKALLVFDSSREVAAVELSQALKQHPAQWVNLSAKVICDARTAGLIVYKPTVMELIIPN